MSTSSVAAPVLATKLTPPSPVPTLVDRSRLTERLDEAARNRLVVVVAPAGSGKSSLVSQWCRNQQGMAVGWVSLDEADGEPRRFLLYVCAALHPIVPEAVSPLMAILSAPQLPSLYHLTTLLLNGLAQSPVRIALVLDDYHRIEEPLVHEVVGFLIDHLPPSVLLIIASRFDPPLPLPRLRVRGQLGELRAQDLRFTGDEAAAFLNSGMALSLPSEAADRLVERTEGWIAGLQLAALSLRGHPDPAKFVEAFTGSNRYLVDYLFEEVLQRQPPEVRDFLMRTAVLERMSAPLCEAVWERKGGQEMLERLEAANLFLIPLDPNRRWYRYHHLFADVLRARLLESEAQAAALHSRAAAWYEANGFPEEAIDHAVAGKDHARAGALVERHWEDAWRRSDWRQLERWTRSLPDDLIERHPQVGMAKAAVCTFQQRTMEAERILSSLRFDFTEDTPENREIKGRWCVGRSWNGRMVGKLDASEEFGQEALALLGPQSHASRGTVMCNLALIADMRGDLDRAEELFEAASRESRLDKHLLMALRSGYGAGQIREGKGELRAAQRAYEELVNYAGDQGVLHSPWGAFAFIFAGLGRLAMLRGDFAGAAEHVTMGIDRCRSAFRDTNPVLGLPCFFEMARVKTATGNHAEAAELVDRSEALVAKIAAPTLSQALTLLRVRLKGASSELTESWLTWFEADTDDGSLPSQPPLDFCLPDLRGVQIATWARLRLARAQDPGQVSQLQERLERFLRLLETEKRCGAAVDVRLVLAASYGRAGRMERAVSVLEPALRRAAREGYILPFLETGATLAPVLKQAAAQGIEISTVSDLLGRIGGETPPLRSATDTNAAPIESLSERELEVLRLVAAGLRNSEIAEQLFVSLGTVKKHVHNISEKLGAESRTAAVALARDAGLL